MRSIEKLRSETLMEMFGALHAGFGPQHWWPGESSTEIVIGAILTQNTNWKNVEKAIENLKAADMVAWSSLHRVSTLKLAELIRPAGYFNVKAQRLKNFVNWLFEKNGGDFELLRHESPETLRAELLSVNGIGPETADSIMLYALDIPTFVIDAYTARLMDRHFLAEPGADYEDLKAIFESNLPRETQLFNEYHALIVAVGKRNCKKRSECSGCTLERFPHKTEKD